MTESTGYDVDMSEHSEAEEDAENDDDEADQSSPKFLTCDLCGKTSQDCLGNWKYTQDLRLNVKTLET